MKRMMFALLVFAVAAPVLADDAPAPATQADSSAAPAPTESTGAPPATPTTPPPTSNDASTAMGSKPSGAPAKTKAVTGAKAAAGKKTTSIKDKAVQMI